ncbi:hypothetical protein [Brochothrix thermosphacta]|uniref:hypothetical protein n=1 Tax=Brochothrix thermosphacta TaxID=2756 RepID=UPI000D793199|nr:hypothetical protein [Brochothrix thermosphacta]SPN75305.1 conserved hypothetical protein [Brochothrix thermosphacta]
MKKTKNNWKISTVFLLVLVAGMSGFAFYTGILVPGTGGKEHIIKTYFHYDNVCITALIAILIYLVVDLTQQKEKR